MSAHASQTVRRTSNRLSMKTCFEQVKDVVRAHLLGVQGRCRKVDTRILRSLDDDGGNLIGSEDSRHGISKRRGKRRPDLVLRFALSRVAFFVASVASACAICSGVFPACFSASLASASLDSCCSMRERKSRTRIRPEATRGTLVRTNSDQSVLIVQVKSVRENETTFRAT